MQRYFISETEFTGAYIKADFHHIKNVLRMKTGDNIIVCFKRKAFLCQITEFANEVVRFNVIKENTGDSELKIEVTLFVGFPKGDKLDFICEKATELGAAKIKPVMMERSIVKLDERKRTERTIRLKRICKEAAEQAERNFIPEILAIEDLRKVLFKDYDYLFVCYERETENTMKKYFEKITPGSKIGVLFGPEGGISNSEFEYLKNNNFQSISLGKRILRAETAPLTFLSMLIYQYEL
ncbi:MAG: 16S rRNA (uracil(1498)-N(3))-methyltransferase [Erysipelotrichales bacterium]|nr:16S rRNA (uracil(1498)-N(3))-methyltransferase [Erysipelotrichales bacterium]